MNTPEFTAEGLSWALHGGVALVRVQGRASLRAAADLRGVGRHLQAQGVPRLILDAGACEAMDSTFLGTLLGLASALRAAGGGLCIARAQPVVRRSITTLGISSVVEDCGPQDLPQGTPGETEEEGREPEPPTPGNEAPGDGDPQLRRLVVEAHEALADLSEANRREFGEVLRCLREGTDGG
jgi:anti-anti-sigma factor